MQRISQFHLFILKIQSILESRDHIGYTPLLSIPNYPVLSICSGKMVHLEIPESDWLRPFWPISQKQDYPKYKICAGTQQIT